MKLHLRVFVHNTAVTNENMAVPPIGWYSSSWLLLQSTASLYWSNLAIHYYIDTEDGKSSATQLALFLGMDSLN